MTIENDRERRAQLEKERQRNVEYRVNLTPYQVFMFRSKLDRLVNAGDASYEKLAAKLPVLPREFDALPEIEVGFTYREVEAIRFAIVNDGSALQLVDIAEWLPGERITARKETEAHLELMDKFVLAGGEDNLHARDKNETRLMHNRVWGGEALLGDRIDWI